MFLFCDIREKDANMAMYEARQKQLRKQLNRKCGDMRDGNLQEKALEVTLEAAKLHCGNLSAEEDQLQAADIDVKKRKVCYHPKTCINTKRVLEGVAHASLEKRAACMSTCSQFSSEVLSRNSKT